MFILQRSERRSLHETLYLEIRKQIVKGALGAHTRLPSVRQLAAELAISRNTVEYVYEQLCTEGYLYSKPRSGYYVSLLDQEFAVRPAGKAEIAECFPAEPKHCYDFHPAAISPEDFPAKIWRRLLSDSMKDTEGLTIYGNPQGELDLRVEIQQYLARYRGVVCNAGQIIICAGLQDSLSIIAQILQERHSMLAVEDPGHWLPRTVFQRYSFAVSSIPVTERGMDLECLKKTQSTIAYVTPSHQFPLGYVMPVERRLQLLHWAETVGGVIIEDDYDSELRYHGKPVPALQGLHPEGDIFYIGTFSKVLSPALRVSYMIIPDRFVSMYHRLFSSYAPTVSLLEQKNICEFMRKGYWERHLRKMRTNNKRKHDVLLQAVSTHFGHSVTVSGQGAGLHVIMNITNMVLSEEERLRRALERQVRVFSLAGMYQVVPFPGAQVILGFGRMDIKRIERGVELLAEAWRTE